MKLLLDANLSWRLVERLHTYFPEVFHVNHILPTPASDIQIWEWAKDHDAMIVTNDDDYYYLLLQKSFPPKVILLRTGNQSSRHVVRTLLDKKPDIEHLHKSGEYGLLEIF